MKILSFSEFKEMVSAFEKEAGKKILEFRDNTLADKNIISLIVLIPPPLGNILLDIYVNSEGETPQEKYGDVMGYLKTIEYKEKEHYYKTKVKLDDLIGDNIEITEISEEQIRLLQRILVSQGKIQDKLIEDLLYAKKSLRIQIEQLDRIEEDLDSFYVDTSPDTSRNVVIPKSLILELDSLTEQNNELKNKPRQYIDLSLKIATAYYYEKQYEKMRMICESVLLIDPNNVDALNDIGIYCFVTKNYQKAIEYYNKAITVKSDYHLSWINLGILLNAIDKYDEALSSFEMSIAIKPDYELTWYNRGISLDKLGRYDEAISSYDRALEIKPDDFNSLNNQGKSFYHLGRYDEAISSFDKAIELNPNFGETWYHKGRSLHRLGRYDEAISSYDRALAIKPDFHGVWNSMGVTFVKLGRYEKAEHSIKKAIELDPNNMTYQNTLKKLKNLNNSH